MSGNPYIDRSLTLSDLKVFNQKWRDKLADMERKKIRIVKDSIDPIVKNLCLIVPDHMDPTEFQDVLMRMSRRIEISFGKFGEIVIAHGECIKRLCALITVYNRSSTIKWRNLVKLCEHLKPKLEERLSELLSAFKQAEEALFL